MLANDWIQLVNDPSVTLFTADSLATRLHNTKASEIEAKLNGCRLSFSFLTCEAPPYNVVTRNLRRQPARVCIISITNDGLTHQCDPSWLARFTPTSFNLCCFRWINFSILEPKVDRLSWKPSSSFFKTWFHVQKVINQNGSLRASGHFIFIFTLDKKKFNDLWFRTSGRMTNVKLDKLKCQHNFFCVVLYTSSYNYVLYNREEMQHAWFERFRGRSRLSHFNLGRISVYFSADAASVQVLESAFTMTINGAVVEPVNSSPPSSFLERKKKWPKKLNCILCSAFNWRLLAWAFDVTKVCTCLCRATFWRVVGAKF